MTGSGSSAARETFLFLQVQWQDELVLVKDGAVQNVVSGASGTGLLPEIHSMSPVCISNDYVGAVSISGANIAGEGQTVLCRSQGMQSSPALHKPHCFMSPPS